MRASGRGRRACVRACVYLDPGGWAGACRPPSCWAPCPRSADRPRRLGATHLAAAGGVPGAQTLSEFAGPRAARCPGDSRRRGRRHPRHAGRGQAEGLPHEKGAPCHDALRPSLRWAFAPWHVGITDVGTVNSARGSSLNETPHVTLDGPPPASAPSRRVCVCVCVSHAVPHCALQRGHDSSSCGQAPIHARANSAHRHRDANQVCFSTRKRCPRLSCSKPDYCSSPGG